LYNYVIVLFPANYVKLYFQLPSKKNPADRFRPAFQRTRRTYHRIFSMSSFIFNFRQKNPADRFRPAFQRTRRTYHRIFSMSSFFSDSYKRKSEPELPRRQSLNTISKHPNPVKLFFRFLQKNPNRFSTDCHGLCGKDFVTS